MSTKPNPLKAARIRAGMTALQLAYRSGCTPDYIYKLERGAGHLPRLGLARKIAEALEAPLDRIFPEA